MSIRGCIEDHPLFKQDSLFRQRVVRRYFRDLVPEQCPQIWSNALFPFATKRPLTYASQLGSRTVCGFLRDNERETLEVLSTSDPGFSRAVAAIVMKAPSWTQEESSQLSKAHEFAIFENLWFPEYQRYAEHTFNHLINLPLGVLGKLAKKDYCAQALSNRVKLLANRSGLGFLVEGFNSAVRNAISHGNVEFSGFGILFHDRKGTRNIYPSQFLGEFDALVQRSTELLLGCLFFLLHSWSRIEAFGVDKLPLGLHFLAISGGGCHRHCAVERMVKSEATEQRKQINISCTTSSSSRGFHQLEALRLAGFAQDVSRRSYDRASVSFECGKAIASSAFLNLRVLDQIRRGVKPFEALGKVFDVSLLWNDLSSWCRKIDTWRMILSIMLANAKENVLEEWHASGIEPAGSLYRMRRVKNLSVKTLRRVEGIALWSGRYEVESGRLRKVGLHVASKLRRTRVRQGDITGESGVRRKPSHIWFRVFAKDNTLRRLEGRGGSNANILVEGEWKSPRAKSEFVFVQEPSEIVRDVRLQYFYNGEVR